MGVLGYRPTLIAASLLAALAFAGIADGHRHDSLAAPAGHQDLPSFSAGHEQPDRTVHIEDATRVEQASCVGCLQRQRQRAAGVPAPVLCGFDPGSSALAAESVRGLAADACRLETSRGPPRV